MWSAAIAIGDLGAGARAFSRRSASRGVTRPSWRTRRSARARSLAERGAGPPCGCRRPCRGARGRGGQRVERELWSRVPAFSRVEPVSNLGPTARAITTRGRTGRHVGVAVTSAVAAPRFRASFSAARTNGVTPLAAMPTTMSPGRTRLRICRAPRRHCPPRPRRSGTRCACRPRSPPARATGGVSNVAGTPRPRARPAVRSCRTTR